ncbi:MAG: metal ABC transporter permease [Christensenellaceae bacterium]|jgi:zinc transport system permease protein|nr:metal ABC transporter permease [Christensenellaceae bacterium]
MIQSLGALFSYSFLVRALVVGSLVALCAALLGVSLVLKRYSMIGDGLSHVGFGALSVAMALNAAPLAVAIPVVILAAFLLLRLSENSKIKGDAAIALISSAALAAGVMVTALSSGLNADVYSYMFGSILSIQQEDVALSIALSAVVLVLFLLFYNKIFAITFDESFAQATGTHARAYSMLIALLTALTIVIGMRIMGTLLISGLIIFPALTAMRVCRSFRAVVICAALVSVACFFLGMLLSYAAATPVGASIVMVHVAAFALFFFIGKARERR